MIGYRDRQWCSAKCHNTDCDRNFTEEERQKAIKWWGQEDFPIWMAPLHDKCPDYDPDLTCATESCNNMVEHKDAGLCAECRQEFADYLAEAEKENRAEIQLELNL